MENRWSDRDAEAAVERYARDGVNRDLALRTYTTRLLGAEPRLVIHGGGNTSVKTVMAELTGDEVEVLCVKGSGWDMATIEPPGLPAVRLAPLLELAALQALSDEDMVNAQRGNLLDSTSPNPSVETLLHAFLPHKFIDHTHSNAVLALTDQPDGEALCREAYGDTMGYVPYIMPGFALARKAMEVYRQILAVDPRHRRARRFLGDARASLNMYYDEDHERREDRRAQVLRTPISEFELSVRSRNCLAKMDIQSLGDLVHKTETELLAYKNFGETSLQEIKDILAQKGLNLGMPAEDDAPLRSSPAVVAGGDAQIDALFGAPSMPGSFGTPGAAPGLPAIPGMPGAAGQDPTDVSIEKLDLSIRARRCMDNLEIRTVGDLIRHSEAELLASKNFGQTSLNEVRRKLEQFGMSLKRK